MTGQVVDASVRDRSADIRVFASASNEPRTRRVADGVALVASLLVLAWVVWQSGKTTPFERGLIDFVRSWAMVWRWRGPDDVHVIGAFEGTGDYGPGPGEFIVFELQSVSRALS